MLVIRTMILLLAMCVTSYAYSATIGANNMIKLVFVLKITDEAKYREYRNQIKPIMNELGIVVLNEYRISKVVHSDAGEHSVNMLAMFGFPSLEIRQAFFASEAYQETKVMFAESTTNFEKLIE